MTAVMPWRRMCSRLAAEYALSPHGGRGAGPSFAVLAVYYRGRVADSPGMGFRISAFPGGHASRHYWLVPQDDRPLIDACIPVAVHRPIPFPSTVGQQPVEVR